MLSVGRIHGSGNQQVEVGVTPLPTFSDSLGNFVLYVPQRGQTFSRGHSKNPIEFELPLLPGILGSLYPGTSGQDHCRCS